MDYVYAACAFGRHDVEAAAKVSPASPVPEAQALRKMLNPHRQGRPLKSELFSGVRMFSPELSHRI